MKKYLKEIEQTLSKKSKGYDYTPTSIYNTSLKMLPGIPIPDQRKIFQEGHSFYKLSEHEQFKIWNYVWNNSDCFQVMNQALFFVETKKKQLNLNDWKVIKTWGNRVENWAHSDSLSSFYSELHEKYPKIILPEFKKWNSSSNPWKKRLSIVSLYYYSSLRKTRVPSFLISKKMVLNLFNEEHYYIQKGIGWTLREMYNVYPEKTFQLLTKLAKDISPAAWQAATEKLSKINKNRLKSIRNS